MPVAAKNRIVCYVLTKADADTINAKREHHPGQHQGSPVEEGMEFPMIIVHVLGNDRPGAKVNGQVFLDGNDQHWVNSVAEGNAPGNYRWPQTNAELHTQKVAADVAQQEAQEARDRQARQPRPPAPEAEPRERDEYDF